MEEAKEAVEHPMADTDLYFDKLTIRCRTGQNPNCMIAAQSRSQCADGFQIYEQIQFTMKPTSIFILTNVEMTPVLPFV